ncbi:arsenate reductase (glutaredoxin) [Aquisalinus flavus]|uniref:Arsenate reductase n=1 Tax=Aquisalinus flavus TaxID=1526572 RepID=A0A8J2Y5M3_9PROT|nr:arsenate reductase (glutaredoxin) [Aquisalinus flavus]MBD0425578.1 arsenate reductase (glutaredoxin) [Aquisalinus flavus]UNE48799.1 arsenate reductase (glutaredoxin) [Aquisalinus flavus]GGD14932.1 arsenate reductase [Aquisalinus flavus]
MAIEFWHNPRCSKSRQALALLQDAGAAVTVVEYLKTPPTQKRLKEVIALLGVEPREAMRTKDKLYRDLELDEVSHQALIKEMAENPILIERPIAISGEKAVIGRPPETVLALL